MDLLSGYQKAGGVTLVLSTPSPPLFLDAHPTERGIVSGVTRSMSYHTGSMVAGEARTSQVEPLARSARYSQHSIPLSEMLYL